MHAGALRDFHKLQATSHKPVSKTPTPALPEGEGALLDAKRKLQAPCWLRRKSANHEPPTACRSFRFPGRTRGAGEARGPCRTNRHDFVDVVPFITGYELQATGFFLASPTGEVAEGRRGVVGWEVGSRRWEVGVAK